MPSLPILPRPFGICQKLKAEGGIMECDMKLQLSALRLWELRERTKRKSLCGNGVGLLGLRSGI